MNNSCWPLRFARAWGGPVGSGTIKQAPDDFRVTETLGFELDGEGEHAWLWIRKSGTNTAWVAKRLAELCELRPFDVGYAGRKDRRAITEQWFSCYLPGRLDPDWRRVEEDGIEIVKVSRHRKKLRKGNHEGNRFRITIRNLDGDRKALTRRLVHVRDTGFPNYFGEQRFGHDGNNLNKVNRLFAGERVSRSKRDIYISAARAYMFNRVLSGHVEDGSWCEAGEDGRPQNGLLYGVTRKASVGDEAVPPGFESWLEGLERLKVKASRRPWCVVPQTFEWQFEDNGALVLCFGLPSGSYATSLLRELVQYEESVSG